jgi:hypothetical protein
MKPRGIANRAMELRDKGRLDADRFMRRTFTLPVDDAPAKAREILREYPVGGYMTIVEDWCQLSDGTDPIYDAAIANSGLA